MRNLYRAFRMTGVGVAAALLLLVAAAGAAQAGTLLSTGTVYFRPGTTVPYYKCLYHVHARVPRALAACA